MAMGSLWAVRAIERSHSIFVGLFLSFLVFFSLYYAISLEEMYQRGGKKRQKKEKVKECDMR